MENEWEQVTCSKCGRLHDRPVGAESWCPCLNDIPATGEDEDTSNIKDS